MNDSWNVNYYEKGNGKMPALEFIKGLPIKLRAKAFKDIEKLKIYGIKLTMPFSRYMKNGIYELRIQQSNLNARVFYFFVVEKTIIITNGFLKKTERTPSGELNKALTYKTDYERNHKS